MVGPPVMHLGFTGSEPTKEERFVLVVGNRSICQREVGDRDHGGQEGNLSGDLCGSLVIKMEHQNSGTGEQPEEAEVEAPQQRGAG